MAGLGYHEVVTYGFTDSELAAWFVSNTNSLLPLLNPIASHFDVMRPSILTGLLRAASENQARQEQRLRLFEVGRVFLRDPDQLAASLAVPGVSQPKKLAGFANGPAAPLQWGLTSRGVDFYDLKGDLQQLGVFDSVYIQPSLDKPALMSTRSLTETEAAVLYRFLHPGRSALLVGSDDRCRGWFGELHPSLLAELELQPGSLAFEVDLELLSRRAWPSVTAPSRFPAVERDLAFVLPKSVPLSLITETIRNVKNQLKQYDKLINFTLFDQYTGQGINSDEKSLAFRFLFQDTEKTLEDQEVDQLLSEITKRVTKDCQGRLRGAS